MATVVFTEGGVLAMQQGRLIAHTSDIIKPDVTFTLSKEGAGLDQLSRAAIHGSAHHLTVFDVPIVITDGSPLVIVQDLHSARAPVGAIDEPQRRMSCMWDIKGVVSNCTRNYLALRFCTRALHVFS